MALVSEEGGGKAAKAAWGQEPSGQQGKERNQPSGANGHATPDGVPMPMSSIVGHGPDMTAASGIQKRVYGSHSVPSM